MLAVTMPLVISRSTQYLIILSWNILPYFTFFTSACSWKPRSIERSKNDEMHIQPFLFITFSLPMFSFAPPENIRKLFVFWCFQGDQKGKLGRRWLILSYYPIHSFPYSTDHFFCFMWTIKISLTHGLPLSSKSRP